MEEKKLRRCASNKMLGGVCAGLAKYLGVDVTLVRVIYALLVVCGGVGLLAYLLMWIIIPEEK